MSARLFLCYLGAIGLLWLAVSSSATYAATVASLPVSPALPDWDPTCYSTYPQIDTFLHNTATQYPQIATVIDGGLAWEGTRHIWEITLESTVHPGPKPGVFLVAGQHPRDIATTEMLLRLVTYLTQSYGTDPDVTWLLDNRTINIIPSANPDGYYSVYNDGYNQFKNRDNLYCANSINRGADINRNYPYQWNTVGDSTIACDAAYPGPSALSEPESSAVISLFQSSGADLLINLQATGPGILYPWGYTPTPPSDAQGLFALGWAFGRLNGTPASAVRTENSHSPVSGIIDDDAYGQYGIPAYTWNIGSMLSPLCSDLDPLWNAQRPAFVYAAKAAGLTLPTTLAHAYGPSPTGLTVTPDGTSAITLTAVLSSNIGLVAGAVYTIDNPAADGSGISISGSYGSGTVTVTASVDISALPAGRHIILAQGKNDSDQWGVFSSAFFTVTAQSPTLTPTSTQTFTPAPSPTESPSGTSTATLTATGTSPPTQTPGGPTATSIPSSTSSATPIDTGTATNTPFPLTHTATSTHTPTPTSTWTSTPLPSTGTATASSTSTATLTYTVTPNSYKYDHSLHLYSYRNPNCYTHHYHFYHYGYWNPHLDSHDHRHTYKHRDPN